MLAGNVVIFVCLVENENHVLEIFLLSVFIFSINITDHSTLFVRVVCSV